MQLNIMQQSLCDYLLHKRDPRSSWCHFAKTEAVHLRKSNFDVAFVPFRVNAITFVDQWRNVNFMTE